VKAWFALAVAFGAGCNNSHSVADAGGPAVRPATVLDGGFIGSDAVTIDPLPVNPLPDAGNSDLGVSPDAAASEVPSIPDAGVDSAWPTPLRHVVVIVKENHTFDNYFGSFPGADGTLQANGTNACATSKGSAACARAPDAPSHDLGHSHSNALVDWANGRMDGWNQAGGSDNGDGLSYAQYIEQDIPNYWQYARHFVLGDRFFANVLAPSFPGHLFPLAAQAGWSYDDPPTDLPGKIVAGPPVKVLAPHPFGVVMNGRATR
jgi:hypothetical protein